MEVCILSRQRHNVLESSLAKTLQDSDLGILKVSN